jgi:hypothetical protein
MALKLSKLSAALTSVDERTVPFTVNRYKAPQPDGTTAAIVLHLLPGTRDNRPFRNTMLLLSMAEKENPSSEAVDLAAMDAKEDKLIAIAAKHIVRGWSNVFDDDGAPVPYSEEAAIDLLSLLRTEFDNIVKFATDETKFVEPVDITAVTKN